MAEKRTLDARHFLTMNAFDKALRPLHASLSATKDEDMLSSGVALHNMIYGGTRFSVDLVRALQEQVDKQPPGTAIVMEKAVLDAYDAALKKFAGEIAYFVEGIEVLAAKKDFPQVREQTQLALKILKEMQAPSRSLSPHNN